MEPDVSYSDIKGGYAGAGNFDSNPLFTTDDYHLRERSTCIDSGTNVDVDSGIDRNSRPTDILKKPNTNGTSYDVGADEFMPGRISGFTVESEDAGPGQKE